jgi:superoxide dismutase, Fe-Mn family
VHVPYLLTIRQLSSQLSQSPFSRSIHSVPRLANGKDEVFKKYGVPGFLSPAAFDETWTQYQAILCDLINDEVAGTTLENMSVQKLHITTSKQPSKAVLFNHAAQAHHNQFFFSGLSAAPEPFLPNATLEATITSYFESLEHLRDEISDVAMSMFGNGYVWLMCEESDTFSPSRNEPGGPMRILCTYNAGSPFADAHARRQSFDGNTMLGDKLANPSNFAGAFGAHSQNFNSRQPRGYHAQPILCLKMWEHQWMRDYGLKGKEVYVQNWWDRIDWDEVHARLNVVGSAGTSAGRRMHPGSVGLYDQTTNVGPTY